MAGGERGRNVLMPMTASLMSCSGPFDIADSHRSKRSAGRPQAIDVPIRLV
jgi:hypothetical protein